MKFLTSLFLCFLSLAAFGADGYLARTNGNIVIGPGGSGGSQTPWTTDISGANKILTNVSYIYIGSNAPTDADSAFLGGGIKITHQPGVDSHVDFIASGGTNYIQEGFRQQTNGAGVVVQKATWGLSDNILNPPNAFFFSSMNPFVWVNNTSTYPHPVLMQLNAVTAELKVGGNIVLTNTANQFFGNGGGLSNITATATNSLGNLSFSTNAGAVAFVDLPVSSAASAGTIESYSLQIVGTNAITIQAGATGSATLATNPVVIFNIPMIIYTNALADWPKVPPAPGASGVVSSNGLPYMLLSTNGTGGGSTTWTFTNRLGW